MFELALLPLLFAAAEFITGRDYFKKLGIPGRSIWYTGPALTLALALLFDRYSVPVWPLGVAWSLWRSVLGWSSFGGSEDPHTAKEFIGEIERDAAAIVFLIIPAFIWQHPYAIQLTAGAVVFTLVHLALALVQGESKKDITPEIDIARGASFGIIYSLVLLLSHIHQKG